MRERDIKAPACEFCQKPLTKTSAFGMDCENDCSLKAFEKMTGKKFDAEATKQRIFGLIEGKLGPLDGLIKREEP